MAHFLDNEIIDYLCPRCHADFSQTFEWFRRKRHFACPECRTIVLNDPVLLERSVLQARVETEALMAALQTASRRPDRS